MSNRITERDLQALVDRINRATNSPMESWARTKAGKYSANIGNYHLSGAYGGYELHRMFNAGGGVTNPLNTGHIPKRELYYILRAFLTGIGADG